MCCCVWALVFSYLPFSDQIAIPLRATRSFFHYFLSFSLTQGEDTSCFLFSRFSLLQYVLWDDDEVLVVDVGKTPPDVKEIVVEAVGEGKSLKVFLTHGHPGASCVPSL